MRIGVVCGLDRERRCLERGWGHYYTRQPPRCAVGMGPAAAAANARALIAAGSELLIAFGCCGALDPGLLPGALIVPSEVTDGLKRIDLDARALCRALEGEAGRLLSVPQMLADTDLKLEAAARGLSAVDMESFAVAEVAREAGVRCLVVRAVADPLARRLPEVARVAVDGRGRLRPLAIAAALTGRPREWPLVWRTAQDARAAERSLRGAAARLARLAGEGLL